MEIIGSWKQPLEDVLLLKLKREDMSLEELAKIRNAIEMLDGAGISEKIPALLEEKTKQLDVRYEEALKKTQKSLSKQSVMQGIKELEQLGGYRDSEKEIENANLRLKKLKKIPVLIGAAAALVVAAIIAVLVGISSAKVKRVFEEIAQTQTLAEAGKNDEAIEELSRLLREETLHTDHYKNMFTVTKTMLETTLQKQGPDAALELCKKLDANISDVVDYEQVKATTEQCLELKAKEATFDAALSLCDEVYESSKSIIDRDTFWDYASSQIANSEFPALERWAIMCSLQDKKSVSIIKEEGQMLVNECMEQLTKEVMNGDAQNLQGWARQLRLFGSGYPADPDIVLHFLYAIKENGEDLDKLFPEGILLDIPVAQYVTKIRNIIDEDKDGEEKERVYPDISTFLPVRIVEKEDPMMYFANDSSLSDLKYAISRMQSEEEHYEVWLLTDFLFKIPDGMRPEIFSDCKSLICMQIQYINTGSVSEVTTTKDGTKRSESTKSYPYYSALELVTAYELDNSDAYYVFNVVDLNDPIASNSTWLRKQHDILNILKKENMLGDFERAELYKTYKEVIENVREYRLAFIIGAFNMEGDESNDAE